MSVLLERGWFAHTPAWHNEGDVLDYYPGKEEAMERAGHNWDVIEVPCYAGIPNDVLIAAGREAAGTNGLLRKENGLSIHIRSDNLFTLAAHKESFEQISNSLAYEVAEILFDQGFQYDAGVSLDGGKVNALTLLLDEPFTIAGDTSVTLPYGVLRWAHDGSASLSAQSGAIRVVCMNTWRASEAEGNTLGTVFTFRHTANVRERIEDAKEAMKGIRAGIDVYREVAEELATIEVTPEQRDWFVSTIVGDRDGIVSASPIASDRVKENVERERAKINALFLKTGEKATIPDAHKLTAYGLYQAGGEYFDHLRNYRTKDSYVKRTLLTASSEKANLRRTISEAVLVAA
jgi:phage/plasmid-like protein (TIGR03299 family)